MDVRIPVPKGPNDTRRTKEFSEWPQWFTGPEGQRQIFQAAHEVPDGWTGAPKAVEPEADYGILLPADEAAAEGMHDAALGVEADEPAADDRDPEAVAAELVNSHTHAELVAILEPTDVEFLESWPKLKLAQTIVGNGLTPPPAEAE